MARFVQFSGVSLSVVDGKTFQVGSTFFDGTRLSSAPSGVAAAATAGSVSPVVAFSVSLSGVAAASAAGTLSAAADATVTPVASVIGSGGVYDPPVVKRKKRKLDDDGPVDAPPLVVPVAPEPLFIPGDFLRYDPPAAPSFRADALIRDILLARQQEAERLEDDDEDVLMLLL